GYAINSLDFGPVTGSVVSPDITNDHSDFAPFLCQSCPPQARIKYLINARLQQQEGVRNESQHQGWWYKCPPRSGTNRFPQQRPLQHDTQRDTSANAQAEHTQRRFLKDTRVKLKYESHDDV